MDYQQCKDCDHLFPLTETCLLHKTTIDKVVKCTVNCGKGLSTKDMVIAFGKAHELHKLKREKV